MSKIKLTQDNLLAAFIEQLLTKKGSKSSDPKELANQREALRRELEEKVELAMFEALSDEQLDEYEAMLDADASDEELEKFWDESGLDFGKVASEAMRKFAEEF